MLFNITNSAEFTQLVEVNEGINYLNLKPSMEMAHTKFLKPILGTAFLAVIEAYYSAPAPPNTIIAEVLAKAQLALANLTLYLYVPIAEVQFTDAGIRRGSSDSLPGAYKYQVKELQRAYLERGFHYLEEMIACLDTHVADSTLNTWTTSEEFKQYRSLLITSGAEFEKLFTTIRYPRRMYTLLQSTMYNTQELVIQKSISKGVYDQLLQSLADSDHTLTVYEKELLKCLKQALAHLTVGKGIVALIATMDENGIHVLSNNMDATTDTSKRVSASENVLDVMIKDAIATGEAWLTKAVEYLNSVASVSIFPDWYTLMNTEVEAPTSINSNLSGSFSM